MSWPDVRRVRRLSGARAPPNEALFDVSANVFVVRSKHTSCVACVVRLFVQKLCVCVCVCVFDVCVVLYACERRKLIDTLCAVVGVLHCAAGNRVERTPAVRVACARVGGRRHTHTQITTPMGATVWRNGKWLRNRMCTPAVSSALASRVCGRMCVFVCSVHAISQIRCARIGPLITGQLSSTGTEPQTKRCVWYSNSCESANSRQRRLTQQIRL